MDFAEDLERRMREELGKAPVSRFVESLEDLERAERCRCGDMAAREFLDEVDAHIQRICREIGADDGARLVMSREWFLSHLRKAAELGHQDGWEQCERRMNARAIGCAAELRRAEKRVRVLGFSLGVAATALAVGGLAWLAQF